MGAPGCKAVVVMVVDGGATRCTSKVIRYFDFQTDCYRAMAEVMGVTAEAVMAVAMMEVMVVVDMEAVMATVATGVDITGMKIINRDFQMRFR